MQMQPATSNAMPTYGAALKNNLVKASNIQTFKIIPPFTKDDLESPQRLERSFQNCINSIMNHFPSGLRNNLTMSKTFTKIRDKNLHSITITGPNQLDKKFEEACLNGIEMMGKTVFPYMSMRTVNIKIGNLPFICSEAALVELLELPDGVTYRHLHRQKAKCDFGEYYTGNAALSVVVPDDSAAETLRQWSYKARTSGPALWNDIPIFFHIPTLHYCSICNKGGHNDAWCFLNKKTRKDTITDDEQPNDNTTNQATEETTGNSEPSEGTEIEICSGSVDEAINATQLEDDSQTFDDHKSNAEHQAPEQQQQNAELGDDGDKGVRAERINSEQDDYNLVKDSGRGKRKKKTGKTS